MAKVVVVDAGPLVALLDRSEKLHSAIVKTVGALAAPFYTAEPVLTEACFLLRRVHGGSAAVLTLVRDGLLRVDFSIERETDSILKLMNKYADVPMSLADACLVRMVELRPSASVLTFDSDFQRYRAQRNKRIERV